MKNRLKKITAITAALVLAITVGAGAYVGLGPQTTQANEVPEVSVRTVNDFPGAVEGATANFLLVADQALEQTLDVTVAVSQDGDVMVAVPGSDTFTIDPDTSPTGPGFDASKTYLLIQIHTDDDEVDEDDGTITLTVQDGDGYSVSASANEASLLVYDNDGDVPVFHNADDGPKVFIGTGGVKFGEVEEASLYIRPGSNGEKVHYAKLFFAASEWVGYDEDCRTKIGKYANTALAGLYNIPEHGREMQPVSGKSNKYSFWGPNHPNIVNHPAIGNDPDCYTNGGGMGVFLYNADEELIHTWAPDMMHNKSAFGKNSNGHVIFPFQCGYEALPDGASVPFGEYAYSKQNDEWVKDEDGTHIRWCQRHEDFAIPDSWESLHTNWWDPQPGNDQFLIDQRVHFSNR